VSGQGDALISVRLLKEPPEDAGFGTHSRSVRGRKEKYFCTLAENRILVIFNHAYCIYMSRIIIQKIIHNSNSNITEILAKVS
jgi:hypothetical protein